MSTATDERTAETSGQIAPVVRRFRQLPLGTRFRYRDGAAGDSVFVILERHGCGLIAKWQGINGPVEGQQLSCLAETEELCESAEVDVVE